MRGERPEPVGVCGSYVQLKDCERELLARQTEEFLRKGGTIKQVASDVMNRDGPVKLSMSRGLRGPHK